MSFAVFPLPALRQILWRATPLGDFALPPIFYLIGTPPPLVRPGRCPVFSARNSRRLYSEEDARFRQFPPIKLEGH